MNQDRKQKAIEGALSNDPISAAKRSFGDLLRLHMAGLATKRFQGAPLLTKQLAYDLRVSTRTVGNWLSGRSVPANIRRLEAVLFGESDEFSKAREEFRECWQDSILKTKITSRNPAASEFKIDNKSIQESVLSFLERMCADLDIPVERVHLAVNILLGEKYAVNIKLPEKAPSIWSSRSTKDRSFTPLDFLKYYWGDYIKYGVLSQADLRRLDPSLFEAVKIYCRNRLLDPKDYLPPPSRLRKRRDDDLS